MAEREQQEERRRQWRAFHRWEAQQPPVKRPPAAILADIGAIREWLPREARLADPDPEKLGIQAMRRALARLGATLMDVAGTSVRVATVEDLILMKLVSERERDQEDARRLLRRFGKQIDRGYLEPRLTDLAESLARPEIRRMLDDAPGGG